MAKRELPFPVASVVRFKSDKNRFYCKEGTTLLVHKIGYGFGDYSLLGHRAYGTKGSGMAWVDHEDLELVSQPTLKTFKQLQSAIDYGEG